MVLSTQSLESSAGSAAFLVFPVAHFLLSVLGLGTRPPYVFRDYANSSGSVRHLAHTQHDERRQP